MPFWNRTSKRPFQADENLEKQAEEETAYPHSLTGRAPTTREDELPSLPRGTLTRKVSESSPDSKQTRDFVVTTCPGCNSILKVERRQVAEGFPCPACETQLALTAEQLFPTHQTLPSFRIADGRIESVPYEKPRIGVESNKPNRNWEAAKREFSGYEAEQKHGWREAWDRLLIYLGMRKPPQLAYIIEDGRISDAARKILETGTIDRGAISEDGGLAPASTYLYRKSILAPEKDEEDEAGEEGEEEADEWSASDFSVYEPEEEGNRLPEEEDISETRVLSHDLREAFAGNWDEAEGLPAEALLLPRQPTRLARALDSFRPTRWLVKDGTVQGLLLAAVVVLMAVIGLAATFALSGGPETAGSSDAPSSEFQWIRAQREEYRNVALRYVQASDIESRAEYVVDPERVKPLMKKHYADNRLVSSDGAFIAQDQWNGSDRDDGAVVELNLPGMTHPLLLLMENSPNGWKVNWEVSEGYEPITIAELRKDLPRKPVQLRFFATRSKYYNWQFEDRKKYLSFELKPLGQEDYLHGFVLRDSSSGRKLDRLIDQNGKAGVVLQIRYPDVVEDDRVVIIDEFVQAHWRSNKQRKTITRQSQSGDSAPGDGGL